MPEKDTIIHSIKIFFKPAFHSDDDEEDNETASLGFVGLYSKKNSVIFYYPECYPCLELLEKGGHSVNRDDSSICLLSSDGAPEYLENIVLPILHTISLLNPQRIEGDFKDSSRRSDQPLTPFYRWFILSMIIYPTGPLNRKISFFKTIMANGFLGIKLQKIVHFFYEIRSFSRMLFMLRTNGANHCFRKSIWPA